MGHPRYRRYFMYGPPAHGEMAVVVGLVIGMDARDYLEE